MGGVGVRVTNRCLDDVAGGVGVRGHEPLSG